MKFRIPGMNKLVYLRLKVIDLNEVVVGLISGKDRESNHYIFLDYDDCGLEKIESELRSFMQMEKIPKFLVVESSPGKYHALSFSPRPFLRRVGIMNASSCDKRQAGHAMQDGYCTLRFTAKAGSKPKIIKELEGNGSAFYYHVAETAYRKLIGED